MAIRIRRVGDKVVALCAAISKPKKMDIYLDDAVHHALSTKFLVDFWSEGFMPKGRELADDTLLHVVRRQQGGKLY